MCSPDSSFLAQDNFYVGALHVLSAIEVPIHLFGAYIVLSKTPLKMTSVKQSMIILHLVGAFFDLYLSFIAMPVFTLPFCAGYPLGVSVTLGIPTVIQTYLGFCFLSTVVVAILSFFEDRYYVLINGPNHGRNWKRKAYILCHYIFSYLFILPAYFDIPDQTVGKLAVLEGIPCFPPELLSRPGFFVMALDSTIFLACAVSWSIIVTIEALFFAISIAWKLSDNTSKSKITNRLQKQFMVALGIQVVVPIIVLFLPALCIIVSFLKSYYNQGLTNLAFIAINCHGITSTTTMLTVHRPYRDAVCDILHLKRTNRNKRNGSQIWKTGAGGIGTSI